MAGPELTLAKVEIPIKPEDTGKVVDALVEMFSPISEALGMVGDHVRLYRIRSVLRVLSETRALAEQSGLKLKRPPLRFLVPFLEEASLNDDEDTQDDELVSLWASLLLQASQDNGRAKRLMIDVLSRLTASDAQNLEMIVRNPRTDTYTINQLVDVAFEFERRPDLNDRVTKFIEEHDEEVALEKIVGEIEGHGIIVVSCGFYSIGEDDDRVYDVTLTHDDFPDEDDLSLHALAALGLVKFPVVLGRPHRGGRFNMIACVVTALGADFFLSTHDPKLRNTGSRLSRYEPDRALMARRLDE
jgi:hypothetical protein